MKKKLLMAAVGAALVAGPMVAAHAAGATLYGHMHMSMDRYDNDVNEEGMMANNSSRFGIKGDEDLGGGLKAIYQLESGIAPDEGTGGLVLPCVTALSVSAAAGARSSSVVMTPRTRISVASSTTSTSRSATCVTSSATRVPTTSASAT
jgi:hypothetical protein